MKQNDRDSVFYSTAGDSRASSTPGLHNEHIRALFLFGSEVSKYKMTLKTLNASLCLKWI